MKAEDVSLSKEDSRGRRWQWVLLLLTLLISFGCVFCSAQLALDFWEDSLTPASLLSQRQANYRLGAGDKVKFSIVKPQIVLQAATDTARLRLTPTGKGFGTPITVAQLPFTPTPGAGSGSSPALPQGSSDSTPAADAAATRPPVATETMATTPTPFEPATQTPPPTPTELSGTATATPQLPLDTPTGVPTATPAVSPSATPATAPASPPTATPVPTSKPGATANPDPTNTPAATSTATTPPTETATPVPTATLAPTDTPTVTPTPTDTPTPESVSSVFEGLVDSNGNNTCTAQFGYDNPNPYPVTIAVGPDNRFNPTPIDRGQPTTFAAGRVYDVFRTDFNSGVTLVWYLQGHTATTPSCPTVQFSSSSYRTTEWGGQATITTTLSAASPLTVTVDYATVAGGTAAAGSDYQATAGTLTFAPGDLVKTFDVPLINDAQIDEISETVLLALSNVRNGDLGLNSATLTLVDVLYRRKLTFDNAAQAESLAEFPVMVRLDGSRINYGQIQDAGQDLRFFDADGTTLLSHEIEVWDETGSSTVWVKVPQIDGSSTSDFIWLYYGNPTASDGQSPANVWTASYEAVHHFNNDPSGSPPQIVDSTANNHDGTTGGSMASTQLVPGRTGEGLEFDDSDDWMEAAPDATLRGLGDLTMSAWVNFHNLPSSGWFTAVFVHGEDGEAEADNVLYSLLVEDTGEVAYLHESGVGVPGNLGANNVAIIFAGSTLSAGNWYHLAVTRDVGSRQVSLYINGGLVDSQGYTNDPTGGGAGRLYLGSATVNSPDQPMDGILDEARLAPVIRSADWLAAQYASMVDTFITFESEEYLGP